MASITLTARSPLDGAELAFGDTTLREVPDATLASIAIPLDGDKALAAKLKSAFGLDMPGATDSTASGSSRLVRMAEAQLFLIHVGADDAPEVGAALDGTGYVTDQSDNWVVCEMSGPGALRALERIVPVDLHGSAFPEGAFARTVMEHMGAAILRAGPDRFWLMSASSSAKSFWHALETSLRYTQTPGSQTD